LIKKSEKKGLRRKDIDIKNNGGGKGSRSARRKEKKHTVMTTSLKKVEVERREQGCVKSTQGEIKGRGAKGSASYQPLQET